MELRRAVIAVLLLSATGFAFADVTGTWSGTISGPQRCNNGGSAVATFSVELDLMQSGNVVAGSLQGTGPNDACVAGSPAVTLVTPVNANVSGSSFSGTYTGSGGGIHSFIATVNGTSMNLSLNTGDGGPLTGTLTQTSTQPPASTYTGTYDGTFTSTFVPCGKLPPITFSGTLTAGFVQSGAALTGSATISNDKSDHLDAAGNCTVIDNGPSTALVTAQISGSSITGAFLTPNEKAHSFAATIVGNTISGGETDNNPGESFTFSITRSSTATPGPAISSFAASPSTINAGDSATLSWSTINASGVSIDNGIGSQPASGSVTISPKQTTTYTLTGTGLGGSATASTTVTVNGAGPRIVVGALPSGMIQATGSSGATDSFTLSNIGTSPGSLTLTQSGNFFTIAPASFTLAPGSSQFVGITASAQAAGAYDGTITVSGGATVPVHLLVAAPPTAPVIPQTNPRSDVSAPAGTNPTGSISVTNSGAGTLQGIAVSDVPWIIPQSGVITIGPGQTTQITFTIDRSRRPDTAALLGALSGRISLVYLASASAKTALAVTPTGSVSVTIVDVVKPNVAAGAPPPLNAGELAYFIDGLRTNNRFNGDLLLSSRNGVPDLKMFLSAMGQQQIGGLPAIPSNVGVAFPAVIKNVFGLTGLGGSLQVRSSDNANVALSAVVSTNGTNAAISSITALPILRSDRSIGAGDRLVFTGADNSTADGTSASIFVQEVSGNAGHVSFEYRDANGNVVGNDGTALNAFAFFTGTVPAAARSIIMTNDSSGSARVSGYASVQADGSGDSWILVDPKQFGSGSGSLIMPMVAAGAQTDIYVANASNNTVSVTFDVESGNRRHSVRLSGGGVSPQAITIAPMATSRTTLTPTNGYVRINAGSGSVSAAGRVTRSVGGTVIGSSLPAVPAGSAIGNGQSKRFAGVDDSSPKTVAAATANTYRSTLMLVEAAGQSATVRVTLRYTFIASATTSSQAVSSKDFALGPNQVMTIADLGRAIIGPQRDAFGDLRNMQVDIDVIDGSGKVLAFMTAIDNGSGDIAVRAE